MKIVADEKIPYLKGVLEKYVHMDYLPGAKISTQDLLDADALITRSVTNCNHELLQNTKVKFIATATIGDDHIDKEYCKRNSIQWSTAKGCNSTAVSQFVLAGLLAFVHKHEIELKDKTIGIIGVGDIGTKVKQLGEILGMNVLLNDPPKERNENSELFCSLEEIQQRADIISLHVPLNLSGRDKTFHLLDEGFFKNLKKRVVLINTSRGAVLETLAVKKAIQSGKVLGSFIDVWENEPNPDEELLSLVDIATPHIAGYSMQGKVKGTSLVLENICRFFEFRVESEVNIQIQNIAIEIDGDGLSEQEIIYRSVISTYNILSDHQALVNDVRNFSHQRNNYNFRKEFASFLLKVKNCNQQVINKLQKIGFKIEL